MSTYNVLAAAPEAGGDLDEWLRERSIGGRIGASESAAILGLSPWSTPHDVWLSKQPGAEPIPETRFMVWGKRLESVVASAVEEDHGSLVGHLLPSPGLLQSRDVEWLLATPDRENTFSEDGFVSALTEIKTGSAFKRGDWFDEDGGPAVPPYYEVQVQQQMIVRGLRRAFIGALIGGNELLVREVSYNAEFANLLIDELDDWRRRYYLAGEAPPATARDVHKFAGKPKGSPDAVITATPSIIELVRERKVVQPEISSLTKRDKELKGDIQAFMGDRTELVDEDEKLLVTWYAKTPTKTFDEAAFRSDEPTLWDEYSVPGPRVLQLERLEQDYPELYAEYVREKPSGRVMLFK